VAGESLQLGQIIVKEAGAKGAAEAEAAAQAEDMAEGVAEDMEEAEAEEPRPWLMASISLTSPGLSPIKNGPHSPVRTGDTSMKKESAGAHRMALLEKSVQLRLLLPLLTDRPSPSKNRDQKITMEELAVPLALVAVPILDGDEVDADVIDLTLLDTGYSAF